jgi:hypothetical protein
MTRDTRDTHHLLGHPGLFGEPRFGYLADPGAVEMRHHIRRITGTHHGRYEWVAPVDRLIYQCWTCGLAWEPIRRPNGNLPDRWWQCPRDCNAHPGPVGIARPLSL